ncbi:sensor histidine kinase [Clostridium botulinum]|uniref:sensor histidine kinase n=1 Tax=Clostridium botulinum TaxID=1491 RepID=UPI002247B02B|nr:ATP-binding protein [Clostridium botulinum]UZP02591.1 sensor histidine kinase [Clostridium botulinum]UZP05949.1 sensor histidine kinase [Clostridium botulinum]UZP09330.1 sensor histidine kinase [Clostridium botulinum]
MKSYYTFLLSFMVMFSLSEIFSKENVYILIESKFNLFILLALSLLLFVICEMLSIKLITSEKLDYILLSTNIFIPISMFVLLISKNYSFFYILNFSRHSYLVSAVFLGSTLLEFYFAVFAIVAISKSYDVSLYKHKNQILNMQYDLQVSNFRMLEEHEADIRRISHDINNHKTILYNLIKDKNYDEALSYLEKYGSGFSNVKYEVLTNNKILNALFLSKKDICINNNITLKLDIGLPQNLGISDFDLCIIVGNLFDNAIEACNKMESCNDKYITLKSKIINNNFVFELKNSFNGIINTNNNSFITLKKDSLNHGLGISNVRDTINKYIGTLDFKASDNEFSAFIRIPIN